MDHLSYLAASFAARITTEAFALLVIAIAEKHSFLVMVLGLILVLV